MLKKSLQALISWMSGMAFLVMRTFFLLYVKVCSFAIKTGAYEVDGLSYLCSRSIMSSNCDTNSDE